MARTLTWLCGRNGFPGVEEPYGLCWSISHRCKGVQMESVSSLCHHSGLKMCVVVVWSIGYSQNTDWCAWQYWYSRFRRALWSVVCHISWVDWYSGGANLDFMSLQWAQKVCIHGLIQ